MKNVHYLNQAERESKVAELAERQRDPKFDIELRLLKDESGWYADVPNHTRGQNSMVSGADTLCDRMALGGKEIVVKFRTVEDPSRKTLFTMKRVMHLTGYGAEYLVMGASAIPFPAYICDVGHDVMGEHAPKIYIYAVNGRTAA